MYHQSPVLPDIRGLLAVDYVDACRGVGVPGTVGVAGQDALPTGQVLLTEGSGRLHHSRIGAGVQKPSLVTNTQINIISRHLPLHKLLAMSRAGRPRRHMMHKSEQHRTKRSIRRQCIPFQLGLCGSQHPCRKTTNRYLLMCARRTEEQ